MGAKYSAKDIEVLEGLDPVRVRPGMYIGSTDSAGLHHLVWEALDNSVDEAINGHCNNIIVTITKDNYISIEDNGRGIPIDKHPKFKKPALELIMTTLHSGAKFSTKTYYSSGGLHGVGVSVVNALSKDTIVEVFRDKKVYQQQFSRGEAITPLRTKGKSNKQGSKITFLPDDQIFSTTAFNRNLIKERVRTKAFLNSGLTIEFVDEVNNEHESYCYPNGIKDYLNKLLVDKELVLSNSFYFKFKGAMQVELALNWTRSTESKIYSYANSVYTGDGGTHENGLKVALTKVLRDRLQRRNGKATKSPSITMEDVKEGLVATLSIFLPNPQFQGQTKEKLNNRDAQIAVESAVKQHFEQFLLEYPASSELIVQRVLLSAQARLASRQAKDSLMRKSMVSNRLTLPGKLADCASTNLEDSELFIVEGDSAGGSTKQARDRKSQAILPIRGKILNVEHANSEKITNNSEIKALEISIGTGVKENFDISKLRYGKIIIMTDADVDGAHISVLLLTYFFRFMPELIVQGRLYIAQPPLYRIEIGKKVEYAYDDSTLERILSKHSSKQKVEISRYKGLGEMPTNLLRETTMDKSKRRLIQVRINKMESTDKLFKKLMGKEAVERYNFIINNSSSFIKSGSIELDI
ncbi:MAG: DNA gyrase/topoisomerase IV subunit B [Nitrospinota bacterium]